jgi:hypothetical protein
MIELAEKDLSPPKRSRSTGSKLTSGEMMEWEAKCRMAGVRPADQIRTWILSWCPKRTS